jgi:glycosyltransferase involved in cell wall biosynthesis
MADEESILALGSGAVAVFPGRPPADRKRVAAATPYLPYPLSHGGAVRMYNLLREAARDYDVILLAFADALAPPPPELLELAAEIVLVRRYGTHLLPDAGRPDVVEEFDSASFRAALRQTVRKWSPAIVQLEFTQLAQYARDCAPAKTVLVEHDITLDLYQQMLAKKEDWETRRQYERWVRFETAAWREVDCVVAMSEKDRRAVAGARRAAVLPNGVDLERFTPAGDEPEPARLLFLGSFAHLPNIIAVDFFLREAWPLLEELRPTLHIIAGARHRYFLDHYRDTIQVDLDRPGVEVEDFVADVRPAYRRAAVVLAPLVASAGTNIKIMEAMAMGKAIVSTPAGINGLDDLVPGRDLLVCQTGPEMAAAVADLLGNPQKRRAIGQQARAAVSQLYGWKSIGIRQRELYEELSP